MELVAEHTKKRMPTKIRMNERYLQQLINEQPETTQKLDPNKARMMGVPIEIDNTIEQYEFIY